MHIDSIYGMNIQQLEYIIAVDRLKNFSKAADICFVTQATLSAMVKKLEEELDVVIFDRKTSPVITTDEGRVLLEHAHKVLVQIEQLHEAINASKKKLEGKLKLGIIPTVASALLPIIIKPILEKFPKLRLDIRELTTQDIIDNLKMGMLDVGIAATPLKRNDEIEASILYYESMMVFGAHDNEEQFIQPEEIQGEIVWLLEEGHCFRDQAIKVCNLRKKSSLPKNLNFEANSFETLVNLAEEFGGITLIPELYYHKMSEARKMKTATFKIPVPVREISMIYYRPYAKLSAVEKLGDEIKDRIAGKLAAGNYKSHELSIMGI